MKTQPASFNLPSTVWESLRRIDYLLHRPLPWAKRLEEINNILVETLEVEVIWLLTIKPLPPTACGSGYVPSATDPDAQPQLTNKTLPLEDSWPPADSLLGQVLANKEPRFIQPDALAKHQADLVSGDILYSTFSAVPSAIIPLVADDKAIGALMVGTDAPAKTPWPEQALDLLIFLGEHLGANLRNTYLLDHARRQTDALRGLNAIAHTITSSLDIDEVIQRTMAGINEILDVEAGSLLLLDEPTNELYFKITLRGEHKQITSYRLQPGEGIAGWVVGHNQPAISNNSQSDRRFSPRIDQAIGYTTKSILCVPLVVQGKPIGVLEVLNKRSGPFNGDDEELLVSIAASLGIALKNAHLYEDVREHARQIEMVNRITTAVNIGHGLSETGKIILEQFGQLLALDHISVSILDGAQEYIRQWVFTEHGCLEYAKSAIPLKGSALAWIVDKNEGRIYDDISKPAANGKPYPDDQLLLEEGIKSKIALPLTTKTRPYGSLNVGHRQAGVYGPSDLQLLEQIMPQIAVAVEKSLLIDVMEQHNTELRRLNHLSEMLGSTTDISLIVDTAMSMLPRLLPGDVHGVIVAQEQGAYLGVAVPFDFNQTEEVIDIILNTFAEISEDRASTKLIYSKSLAGNMPVPTDWKPVTVLHLPILTRLGTLGLIYVASGKKENSSDEVWRTFSLTASQISTAVENAGLFRQIERERARLAAILASSTDAILVVNRDGRIVLDNPAAWQVMAVEGSQSGKLLAESTKNQALVRLFEGAMQGGTPTGEIPLMDERTFFANLSPVSAGDAGVIGWVATMQDVSHFKELNELKNDFVSAVSHDLRSPLTAILIAANLIPQTGEVNEAQQQYVKTIERRVEGMHELIDDLLDVGKIEAGIDMDMELCQLTPIISQVITSLTTQADDKSIKLIGELDKELPAVMANATRIRQVMNNLIGNAVKYTPNGGQVTVKAFRQDDEIQVQVIDTGIGIPAADQPHIFEKFYRVQGDQMTKTKGTGLGLAITKSIIDKHNGRIWLESIFGEGSTFTIALPVHQESPTR